jgi:hypothetical protein
MAVTYKLLSSTTLGSNATNLTISSIPQTYDDLILRIVSQSGVASTLSQIYVQFNGDTTAKYRNKWIYWYGNSGSNIDLIASTDTFGSLMFQGTSSGSSQPGMGVYYISKYSSTTQTKSVSGNTTQVQSGSINYYSKVGGLTWMNSSAGISSMYFFGSGSDNMLAGATFKLYGIKNT